MITASESRDATNRADRRRRIALWTLLAVLLVGAALWQAAATNAYRQSFSTSSTLDRRLQAAALASRLEPWDSRKAVRRLVMADWVQGKKLLDAGDWNRAVPVLAEAYRLDVGDAELLAFFKKAQATQALETNRKAHLQHGHEGPGGTLQPQDIER